MVDVLSRADPLGLKDRSHHLGAADGSIDKALDAVAWALNTADLPGTQGWEEMDLDGRVNWWVRRVGALDTVLVAFPGVFGAVADRLPIQDVLGFTSQAIVLCAVARESGVQDTGNRSASSRRCCAIAISAASSTRERPRSRWFRRMARRW
ncbi:MAG: hypothetical protein QOJ95_1840 [Mycobacterium sp.]|nr:hypothetical protein [Mycobacterium sp.]